VAGGARTGLHPVRRYPPRKRGFEKPVPQTRLPEALRNNPRHSASVRHAQGRRGGHRRAADGGAAGVRGRAAGVRRRRPGGAAHGGGRRRRAAPGTGPGGPACPGARRLRRGQPAAIPAQDAVAHPVPAAVPAQGPAPVPADCGPAAPQALTAPLTTVDAFTARSSAHTHTYHIVSAVDNTFAVRLMNPERLSHICFFVRDAICGPHIAFVLI